MIAPLSAAHTAAVQMPDTRAAVAGLLKEKTHYEV
jgi:hypothetical protein